MQATHTLNMDSGLPEPDMQVLLDFYFVTFFGFAVERSVRERKSFAGLRFHMHFTHVMRSTRTMILAERRRDLNTVANFEIVIEAFRKTCVG